MIFPNLIFQLHPITSPLILDQLACSLPKTNTTFHWLFIYVKKNATFSSIRWEYNRNIFGQLLSTLTVELYLPYNIQVHIYLQLLFSLTCNGEKILTKFQEIKRPYVYFHFLIMSDTVWKAFCSVFGYFVTTFDFIGWNSGCLSPLIISLLGLSRKNVKQMRKQV